MQAQKLDGYIEISFVWVDPETHKTWLNIEGGGWNYESFKSHPLTVSFCDKMFVRSGWNSDTGLLCYREIEETELAKVVKEAQS